MTLKNVCGYSGSVSAGEESGSTVAKRTFRPGAETLKFEAEVSRLMDIIINSLYSNKDIFLRELISNAADALDKIRFLAISDPKALGEGDTSKLEIRISYDKDKSILTIHDRGIGMTKDELVSNLGTIARSGTAAFLEQAQRGGDLNLIGQFGVGFYSVYLVADYVEVITKSNNDTKQWVWESEASGKFAVSEDTDGEPLGRGTKINIHLKDSCQEYLQENKLRSLVERYSEFISFPIYLWTEKNVTKEVPLEEEVTGDKENGATNNVVTTEEEEEEEEEEDNSPKTKTVTELVQEWTVLNDNQALWLRPPGDVSNDEYTKFYKALSKNDYEEPLAYSHFKAEGDVDFKAVLYIPASAPFDMVDNYYTKKPRVKLYVRRVFISDSFEELLPKWLSFVVGLVDSDSMPLNVSREMLQLNEGLKVIRKKLVRKALDLLKKLSDSNLEYLPKEEELKSRKAEELTEDEKVLKREGEKFLKVWSAFSKAIKMGIIEDHSNRRRLLPLLRFHTSKSLDTMTNLDGYVSRMVEGQTKIYYLVGTNKEELAASPFVESLVEKGFEVIYFIDPLDEYVMQNILEFEEKSFVNAGKEDATIETRDDAAKHREKRLRVQYKNMTLWWKDALLTANTGITMVKVTARLTRTPCVVVSGKFGWSATMEKIAMAQAMGDPSKAPIQRGARTLEINPRHPLVRELKSRMEANPDEEFVKEYARVLANTCLLESGFFIPEPRNFNSAVLGLLKQQLGLNNLDPISETDLDASIKDVEPEKPTEGFMRSEEEVLDTADSESELHDMLAKMRHDLAKQEAEKNLNKDEL